MAELDLNLLYVLVALDERRSVSGAARKLHRSQPGVSVALGRLRDFFGDLLFVRSGNGMQPTPSATTLIESARAVIARIGSDIAAEPQFEPRRSSTAATLALWEAGAVVLVRTVTTR